MNLSPAEIQGAYGISQLPTTENGTGQTIAIVNAYDDPSLVSSTSSSFSSSDLHTFDAAYGLADPPSFLKLDENGGTNYPAGDPDWGEEESLDVEWAHSIAPGTRLSSSRQPAARKAI